MKWEPRRCHYCGGVKPRTLEIYKTDIRVHIKPALGAIRLESLNTQTIQSFYNKLAKEGREIRRKDKKGKITVTKAPMSAKSIKNIHGVLHKALQQAVLIGSLRFNPTEACTLPRQEKKELAPLDDEQIAAFLAAIQDSDMKTLLTVTLFTGMREGEVLGLMWECVDFEAGTITINKQLQRYREPGGGVYRISVPKNRNHYASYRLGKEYLKGESVRKDTRKAMDHIYTSAQAGNPHAQYLLGKLLLQGKVVDRDKEEGIQWLTRAAEQGHSYAQCLLERQSASTAPKVFLAVTRLLHHMANIFQDNSLPQSGTGLIHADRKLREQLREKRLAHGHKENDHEEQQYGGWNMTMR